MNKNSLFFIALHIFYFNIRAKEKEIKIITQDVEHFWEAVDNLKAGSDTTLVFQKYVIDRASAEFKVFINKWKIKARDYTKQIQYYPKFYTSLRNRSLYLIKSEDSIRKIVNHFKRIYANFKPANICVAFGNFSTGGNIALEEDQNLVYIGLEYHGADSATCVDELKISTKDYVSRSNFFRTIIHELVHVQQYSHGKLTKNNLNKNYLISRILLEGIPDFIAKLIVESGNNGNYYNYGILHENSLKIKLQNELWNIGAGKWFGGPDSLFLDIPRDLGYFMGARIANAYFANHKNKKQAIKAIIEIKNMQRFIRMSKYFN
jgi:hypothetical protein